ncbi:MAG: ATP-binding protein [Christensenellaceae bacterium]|jgi:molecular chaperone HtpG|nr:ATP-binding protein [Christensenellaceae bacterium]
MEEQIIFGANILDSLTTGMYKNPFVCYREYIQNACDSIDKAVEQEIISNKNEGLVEIWIDQSAKSIEIKDNGTGISKDDFQRILVNVASSDKTLGEDKGFRGIGRLCGMAFCDKLVFSTKCKGENIISTMSCDAKRMRELLNKHQTKEKKYSATEILKEIYSFSSEKTENTESHFFVVKLENIDKHNNGLLNIIKVKEYLSFVAPVPYQNTFRFREEIYKQAKEIGYPIDEYIVKINGEDVYKKYITHLTNGEKKYDEVKDIAFKGFYSDDKSLIAWSWIGVCQFKQAIPKSNKMRGIRLRKENIQIGDENALEKLFKEDRGNNYFIGEVFTIDKNLIPNSQRDYFNTNSSSEKFEVELKKYFDDELYRTYYNASSINSSYKKIEIYNIKKKEFDKKKKENSFVGNAEKNKLESELAEIRANAEKAETDIRKKIESLEEDSLQGKVANIIRTHRDANIVEKSVGETNEDNKNKKAWWTDRLKRCSKVERKIIGKILDIIAINVDAEANQRILAMIEKEFS